MPLLAAVMTAAACETLPSPFEWKTWKKNTKLFYFINSPVRSCTGGR